MSDYWETWYQKGGSSGSGSVGLSRFIKWRTINKRVDIKKSSVIDVGCGDLSFWNGKTCKEYTGIEMSPTRYKENISLRPDFSFINANAADYQELEPANVVFCFDMLFHIMSDADYKKYLIIWLNTQINIYSFIHGIKTRLDQKQTMANIKNTETLMNT